MCENTLNAAIRNAESYVSFRHTKSVHDNIDIADEILGITKSKINFLNEVYNHMYKSTIKDEEVQSFFGKVVFTDDEYSRIYQTGHNIQQMTLKLVLKKLTLLQKLIITIIVVLDKKK